MREDTDNWHFDILLFQVLLVLATKEYEGKDWERKVDHMVELATHLPNRELTWISLRLEVIGSSVEPVSIWVDLKLTEISELIHRMVLEIMVLYKSKNEKGYSTWLIL